MQVQAYLDRVGFVGSPRADLESLRALHRAHLRAVPYENFDVLLGRPMTLTPEAAFDKIVGARRGGWCYEMNGLFAAVLREIGFTVTEMAGAVTRGERGELSHGNHLVLRVDLDRPYLADVGFGDGTQEPLPLKLGPHRCAGYNFRLEKLPDGWLRFHNHTFGGAPYFDFRDEPADRAQLARTCQWLATSPESVFTQTALAFRHGPDGVASLLGRTLRKVRPGGRESHLIGSQDEFVQVLEEVFDLHVPEAAGLWPTICAKHEELFGMDAPA
ncbi:arylamine N-acetyltransferase family protein [Phenylobacterium koreense]|uniref:N-hydroxyarylamine O-acetyltransferase n=1 Tax=Phenylobacterium koreense TaxID=266125 RepID=A0ABV2ENQ6_9CAUL